MLINISPQPKPRMTRSDKWKKRACVMRYYEYCNELRANGLCVSNTLDVVFNMPMPKSWSKKKKLIMVGKPHKKRPDLDNLIKAINDAANVEDSHVWCISAKKLWSNNGSISIGSCE